MTAVFQLVSAAAVLEVACAAIIKTGDLTRNIMDFFQRTFNDDPLSDILYARKSGGLMCNVNIVVVFFLPDAPRASAFNLLALFALS